MEKPTLTNQKANIAIECAIDNVFEDRLYEFIHNLMLEAECKVEELWDISSMEENCDSGERWCDSFREETVRYIVKQIKERI